MNSSQNGKKDFYKDIALQQRIATRLAEKLNEMLPDGKKISDQEIKALQNSASSKLQRRERLKKIEHRNVERQEVYHKYMKENGIMMPRGNDYHRGLQCLIDIDSNVKDDYNKVLLDQVFGKNGRQNIESRLLQETAEFDVTKLVPPKGTPDQIMDFYEKNEQALFTVFTQDCTIDKQMYSNGTEQLQGLINDNKYLMHVGQSVKYEAQNTCSLQNFLIPDRVLESADLGLAQSISFIMSETMNEFKDELDDQIQFEGDVCKTALDECGNLVNYVSCKQDVKFLREKINDGSLRKDFYMNSSFSIDGKEVPYKEAIKAFNQGKQVDIVEKDFFVQKQIEAQMEKPYVDDYQYQKNKEALRLGDENINFHKNEAELGEDLGKLNKSLQGTSSIFNRGSNDFKEMTAELKNFTTMYYQAHPELAAKAGMKVPPGNVSPEQLEKAAHDLKQKLSGYVEYKKANEKKPSKTGEKRMQLCRDIFQKMTGGKDLDGYLSDKKLDDIEAQRAKEAKALRVEALQRKDNPLREHISKHPELQQKIKNDLTAKNDKVVYNSKEAPTLENTLEMGPRS